VVNIQVNVQCYYFMKNGGVTIFEKSVNMFADNFVMVKILLLISEVGHFNS